MTLERKIEKALEDHLRSEGWSIDGHGDHFAEWFEADGQGSHSTISINVTECAKAIAAETFPPPSS